jgi:hypothetical protein
LESHLPAPKAKGRPRIFHPREILDAIFFYVGVPEALDLAEDVDSGADFRLALSEQEAEQRLRAAAGELRSVHLRGHESPNGEEIGSLVRLFRQFQGEVRTMGPMRLLGSWTKLLRRYGTRRNQGTSVRRSMPENSPTPPAVPCNHF